MGGGGPGGADPGNHPAQLIEALSCVPMPVAGGNELQRVLTGQGFSVEVARWWAGGGAAGHRVAGHGFGLDARAGVGAG